MFLVLVPSLCAAAQKVAILPVDCQRITEAGASEKCLGDENAANLAAQKTIAALEDAGFSPVPPQDVEKALEGNGAASLLPCTDEKCVSEIRDAVGADEAVQIIVEDRRVTEDTFFVRVFFGSREGFSFENGAFFVLLEKLGSKISIALIKETPAPQDESEADEEAQEDETHFGRDGTRARAERNQALADRLLDQPGGDRRADRWDHHHGGSG